MKKTLYTEHETTDVKNRYGYSHVNAWHYNTQRTFIGSNNNNNNNNNNNKTLMENGEDTRIKNTP